jgi:hypothetical protein
LKRQREEATRSKASAVAAASGEASMNVQPVASIKAA